MVYGREKSRVEARRMEEFESEIQWIEDKLHDLRRGRFLADETPALISQLQESLTILERRLSRPMNAYEEQFVERVADLLMQVTDEKARLQPRFQSESSASRQDPFEPIEQHFSGYRERGFSPLTDNPSSVSSSPSWSGDERRGPRDDRRGTFSGRYIGPERRTESRRQSTQEPSQERIEALEKHVTRMSEALNHPSSSWNSSASADDIASLRRDMATIGASLNMLAPKRSIESLEATIRELGQRLSDSREVNVDGLLGSLKKTVADMRQTLDSIRPEALLSGIEQEVRSLGRKFDIASSKGIDAAAFAKLQHQISAMCEGIDAVLSPQSSERFTQLMDALADRLASMDTPAAMLETIHRIDEAAVQLKTFLSESPAQSLSVDLEGVLQPLFQKLDDAAQAFEMSSKTDASEALLDTLAVRFQSLEDRLDGMASAVTPQNQDSSPALAQAVHEDIEDLKSALQTVLDDIATALQQQNTLIEASQQVDTSFLDEIKADISAKISSALENAGSGSSSLEVVQGVGDVLQGEMARIVDAIGQRDGDLIAALDDRMAQLTEALASSLESSSDQSFMDGLHARLEDLHTQIQMLSSQTPQPVGVSSSGDWSASLESLRQELHLLRGAVDATRSTQTEGMPLSVDLSKIEGSLDVVTQSLAQLSGSVQALAHTPVASPSGDSSAFNRVEELLVSMQQQMPDSTLLLDIKDGVQQLKQTASGSMSGREPLLTQELFADQRAWFANVEHSLEHMLKTQNTDLLASTSQLLDALGSLRSAIESRPSVDVQADVASIKGLDETISAMTTRLDQISGQLLQSTSSSNLDQTANRLEQATESFLKEQAIALKAIERRLDVMETSWQDQGSSWLDQLKSMVSSQTSTSEASSSAPQVLAQIDAIRDEIERRDGKLEQKLQAQIDEIKFLMQGQRDVAAGPLVAKIDALHADLGFSHQLVEAATRLQTTMDGIVHKLEHMPTMPEVNLKTLETGLAQLDQKVSDLALLRTSSLPDGSAAPSFTAGQMAAMEVKLGDLTQQIKDLTQDRSQRDLVAKLDQLTQAMVMDRGQDITWRHLMDSIQTLNQKLSSHDTGSVKTDQDWSQIVQDMRALQLQLKTSSSQNNQHQFSVLEKLVESLHGQVSSLKLDMVQISNATAHLGALQQPTVLLDEIRTIVKESLPQQDLSAIEKVIVGLSRRQEQVEKGLREDIHALQASVSGLAQTLGYHVRFEEVEDEDTTSSHETAAPLAPASSVSSQTTTATASQPHARASETLSSDASSSQAVNPASTEAASPVSGNSAPSSAAAADVDLPDAIKAFMTGSSGASQAHERPHLDGPGFVMITEDEKPLEPGSAAPKRSRSAETVTRVEPMSRSAILAAARESAHKTEAPKTAKGVSDQLGDALGKLSGLFSKNRKPLTMMAAFALVATGTVQVFNAVQDRTSAIAQAPSAEARQMAQYTPPAAESAPAMTATASKLKDRADDALTTASLPDDSLPVSEGRSVIDASTPRPSTTLVPMDTKLPDNLGPVALRAAAQSGDPVAAFDIASRYAEGRGVARDLAAASRWFEKAATQSLPQAQYRLGVHYEKGLGVARDLTLAEVWYKRAAARGHAKAMHNLAVLYAEGALGSPSFPQAIAWFQQATEFGVMDSLFNLGVLYTRGLGVERDFVKAYTYFDVAAKNGDADAAQKREEIARAMDPQQLAQAKQRSASFVIKTPDPAVNTNPTFTTQQKKPPTQG